MIILGTTIMIVGAILQASATTLPHFIIGRIITGLGNGGNTSTVPTWQSETSRAHKRGKLVMIEGALITCGIMISYWIDLGFSFIDSSVAWRFPLAFQIVFCLFILAFIWNLPESPRWLILKNREDEAREVLAALADTSIDDKEVQNEFIAIKETVIEMSKGSFKDLFTMDRDRYVTDYGIATIYKLSLADTDFMGQELPPNFACFREPNVPADFRHQPHHLLRSSDLQRPRHVRFHGPTPCRAQRHGVLHRFVACRIPS